MTVDSWSELQSAAMTAKGDVTRLLADIGDGRTSAWDELFPIVYGQLQAIAHRQLRGEHTGHSMATTDLVHEAYFALVGINAVSWSNRAHFMAMAARAMRRVLIDHARARGTQKRGGAAARAVLDVDSLLVDVPDEQLLALDEALRRLEKHNDRYGRIVECRFFAGMSIEETASVLGVSPTTVKRDWIVARAWLHRELSDERDAG